MQLVGEVLTSLFCTIEIETTTLHFIIQILLLHTLTLTNDKQNIRILLFIYYILKLNKHSKWREREYKLKDKG